MTTIAYDRPVKDLIDKLSATGHVTHRSYKKASVTLHHNAGRLSHEGVLRVWQTRPASAHFDVDAAGDVAQFVKEHEYAWAAGTTWGNVESIHVEMANETLGPEWRVSETTWRGAARLAGWLFANVVDGRPRPNKNNLFYHHDWKPTICAGPFMDKIYDKVLAEAQVAYDHFKANPPAPRPAAPRPTTHKSSTQIAAEVWAGKWGSGDDRVARLKKAGYNPKFIQDLINRGVGKRAAVRKTISQIAAEVLDGKWGNGDERIHRLINAGYNPRVVQTEVNRRL